MRGSGCSFCVWLQPLSSSCVPILFPGGGMLICLALFSQIYVRPLGATNDYEAACLRARECVYNCLPPQRTMIDQATLRIDCWLCHQMTDQGSGIIRLANAAMVITFYLHDASTSGTDVGHGSPFAATFKHPALPRTVGSVMIPLCIGSLGVL